MRKLTQEALVFGSGAVLALGLTACTGGSAAVEAASSSASTAASSSSPKYPTASPSVQGCRPFRFLLDHDQVESTARTGQWPTELSDLPIGNVIGVTYTANLEMDLDTTEPNISEVRDIHDAFQAAYNPIEIHHAFALEPDAKVAAGGLAVVAYNSDCTEQFEVEFDPGSGA